jgi:methylase of polypeptide subunit release factors
VKTLKNDQICSSSALRVLDLCTGTGCIPLLFHHEFYAEANRRNVALDIVGVDVSGAALSVARENLIHRIADQGNFNQESSVPRRSLHRIGFVQADVLKTASNASSPDLPPVLEALERWRSNDDRTDFDILIANPPYISPREFRLTTSRSVRLFEPQLALVPASTTSLSDVDIGDRFYPRSLDIALQVNAKMVLFEVADIAQAQRVVSMIIRQGVWDEIEVWRDEPEGGTSALERVSVDGIDIEVYGSGNGRSVVARRQRPQSAIPVLEHKL